uniref:BACK domain-containing protein n=1 Tax=Panagrellus redivivus TaxID=6233 RepID=A0A7E4UQN6_PANRE
MKDEKGVYYLFDISRNSNSKNLRYRTPENPMTMEVKEAMDGYLQKKKAYELATNCTVKIDRPVTSRGFAPYKIKNSFTKFINRIKVAASNTTFASLLHSFPRDGISYQPNAPVDVTAILATIRNAYENGFSSHTHALQQFVAQFIRIDNFSNIVNCAWDCSCEDLKKSCAEFLKEHWMEVTSSAEFYHLSADRMKLVMMAAQMKNGMKTNL